MSITQPAVSAPRAMPAHAPVGLLPMGPLDWSALVLLSIIWGGAFFFGKVAVAEVPPLTLVLSRVAIGALALYGFARLSGTALTIGRAYIGPFLLMGLICNVVPFGLIFWAQTHIPSGLASILNATTPLFTMLVAQAFTRDDKLTAGRLAGVVLGFSGVAAMMGPALLEQLGTHLFAQLASIGAAISYGFAAVYGRRFRGLPPLTVAIGQLTASTLILLPIVALIDQPWRLAVPSWPVLGAMLGLGVVSTGIAFVIYFRVLARNGATNISLVTFLVPVSAILLGALVLGEALEPLEFVGFGLIALGLAAIDGRPARFLAGLVRAG